MSDEILRVRVTPGRISKGILSIPVSLKGNFPGDKRNVTVLLDDSNRLAEKPFSPYESTTRECRIYGLSNWYRKHGLTGGQRVIITIVDRARHVYRLCTEEFYLLKKSSLEDDFYSARTEKAADNALDKISTWAVAEKRQAALEHFRQLARESVFEARKRIMDRGGFTRERVPLSMHELLRRIYKGHCQVCDFSFLKKDGHPYFEIHHLVPERGHYPRNLLSVCPNCHRQFELAFVRPWFNPQRWLIRVMFNDRVFDVRQALVAPKSSA